MSHDQNRFPDGQDIRDRSFVFACQIVGFCEQLYRQGGVGRVMAPQLLRSGTSIAAMLEEAKAAESHRDFISKCAIALKEARETHLRLRVHEATKVGPGDVAAALRTEAQQIRSVIGAIVRNARRNEGT